MKLCNFCLHAHKKYEEEYYIQCMFAFFHRNGTFSHRFLDNFFWPSRWRKESKDYKYREQTQKIVKKKQTCEKRKQP